MDQKDPRRVDACYRLLALCARAEPHPQMDARLAEVVRSFDAWDELPFQAELHGMGPLLWHHLKRARVSIPIETQRTLTGLYLRHRGWNQAHTETLLDVTSRFEAAGIRSLVLKGLALAHEYYPDPALRPATDIDLLLKTDDVLPALNLLKEAGYNTHRPGSSYIPGPLPKELTASSQPKNGLVTRLEIHHYDPRQISMIDNSQDDEFAGFNGEPHQVKVGDGFIYVPHPMDTLDYLVKHFLRHMFVANTSSPLPLRWLADIVCLVERHAEEMVDWPRHLELVNRLEVIYSSTPLPEGLAEGMDWIRLSGLLNRLEVIYSLTPMPEGLSDVIPLKKISPPKGVNQYPKGWPQEVKRQWKHKGFIAYISHTLLSPSYIIATLSTPSQWWLRLQYGIDDKSVLWYGNVVYRLQVLKMAFAKFVRRK